MNIELIEVEEKSIYPYIGVTESEYTIVLFRDENKGVAIKSTKEQELQTEWNESVFKRYEGYIEISNT